MAHPIDQPERWARLANSGNFQSGIGPQGMAARTPGLPSDVHTHHVSTEGGNRNHAICTLSLSLLCKPAGALQVRVQRATLHPVESLNSLP